MRDIAYLSLDVHARGSVLGDMDSKGEFRGNREFMTSERNIISSLQAVKARVKYLTIEEGPLSYWAGQVARAYVSEVIICDPRENALIYKGHKKRDKVDTRKLCRLLRLGELHRVYHPQSDDRAIFKAAARHYIDFRDQDVRLQQKIKAVYRFWGVIDVFGEEVYTVKGRQKYLKQVKHKVIRSEFERLYTVMDKTQEMKKSALRSMKSLGRAYPEIKEFKKIPGIGDVGAHIFDAFIQTPHRFKDKSKLWRYCRLGIKDRTSDGKPLGYRRLDKSGVSELKALSYRAWMSAMKGNNEVKRFYQQSLKRTHDRVHARLNTQRKILAVMYGLWKKGEPYKAELLLDPST